MEINLRTLISLFTPGSFLFVLLFFTIVLSHWDFSHLKLGLLSPRKASCDRVGLSNLQCVCWVFWCVYIIYRTLCMRLHTGAYGSVRESALKDDSGRKSLDAPRNRIYISGVTVQCSNHLSYIPDPG